MKYISSDTNVWIDFAAINALALPFRLDCVYFMSKDAIEDEWRSPKGRGTELLALGLQPVCITTEEFYYAVDIRSSNPRLSAYDAFALAIAKFRNMILLTGDGRLRKVAIAEGVTVRGTLWVFDELLKTGKITAVEFKGYMSDLKKLNGGQVRLPEIEIDKRMK